MEKENLTNEKFRERFKSQFEMVNYAIGVAKNMIERGHELHIDANPALEVLDIITEGRDTYELLEVDEPIAYDDELADIIEEQVKEAELPAKKSERSKSKAVR